MKRKGQNNLTNPRTDLNPRPRLYRIFEQSEKGLMLNSKGINNKWGFTKTQKVAVRNFLETNFRRKHLSLWKLNGEI